MRQVEVFGGSKEETNADSRCLYKILTEPNDWPG